uniref:Putative sphingomyelin synthetase family protein n=1 Tax=Juniperus scopulorum TaxID=466205 RepID=A0A3S6KHD7_JUNSC|nr:putative sphingomyelin synthetase family protein [Juniperus scopulorum]
MARSGWSRLRGGLGIAALCYVGIDYLRRISPSWHATLQPKLWLVLALAAICRAPFYPHWSTELRSVLPFLGSLLFMLVALALEATSVHFVTALLGLDWHRTALPLPDTGQWLFLALNEKLPTVVVQVLRAPLIGLHHYLMLFLMLAFSVLFDCVKAPGLGLGARYMFTMAVGRLLRVLTFLSTILPSARPWCASTRFEIPNHPHPWLQKYYVPYASDPNMIRQLLREDMSNAPIGDYPAEIIPEWGRMKFLVNILRPSSAVLSGDGTSWFSTLKRTGGGCNDLIYSGHMLVAVLTAMAWTEAYPGWTSAGIWFLVLHSTQREIRERHHYSVDCIVAIYAGILLWRTINLFWSAKDQSKTLRLEQLAQIEGRLVQAAKDADLEKVREMLYELNNPVQGQNPTKRALWGFAATVIIFSLGIGLLAFTLTADG